MAAGPAETDYRPVFDAMSDAIVVHDVETGRILDVNRKMCEMFGHSREDIPRLKVIDLCGGEPRCTAETFQRMIEKTRDGNPHTFEWQAMAADGRRFRTEVNLSRVVLGGQERVLAVIRDVSRRREAEEALKQSEARYRAIVEDQTELVSRFLPDFTLTFANEANLRYFGKSREEMVGRSFLPLLPESDREPVVKSITRLGLDHPIATIEHRVIKSNGEIAWQQWTNRAIFDQNGEIVEYQSVGRDITARRLAEEALRQTEERYRAIVEAQTEMVCRHLPDGTVTFVNEALCRYFGKPAEELLGRDFWPSIPEEEQQRVQEALAGLSRANPVALIDLWVFNGAGEKRFQQWTNQAIFDEHSRILEHQAVGRDITARRLGEEALRASEAKYRNLVEQIPAITYIAGLDNVTSHIYISPQIEAVLGFSQDEWLADAEFFKNRIHPDDRDRVLSELILSYSQGGPFVSEYRLVAKSGRVVWVRDESRAVYDAHGLPLFMQGVALDITGRKETEEALEEVKRQLETLVQASPLAIVAIDTDARVTSWNLAAERIFGWSRPEVMGRFLPYVTGEMKGEFQKVFQRVLKGESFSGLEIRRTRRDGSLVDINLSTARLRDAAGNVVGIMGVLEDITARKRTAEALLESEARFRAVFEGAGIGIALLDLNRRLLKANRASFEISGYTEAEMRALGAERISHPDDWAADQALFTELVAGKRDRYQVEKRYRHRQGHWIWVLLNISLVRDAAGAPQFAIAMVEDITGRMLAQEERQRMEKALKRVSRALRAITECHQALLRASNETELLNEVCRIIVEVGGYRTAWVGYAETDEAKTVRPVAQKGFDYGYVRDIQVTWSEETDLGRGPVGTAIRESQPAIVRDTGTDPKFAPWRAQAVARGYASVLALPLKDSGTFGALAIYAGELDAFDDQEINLLIGLANDLAYGITALRANAERRRAAEALQESEEKYHGLMDYSSDAIILADLDGNLTEANRRAQELLGYSKEELLQMHYTQLVSPEDLGALTQGFEGTKKEGLGEISEARALRKDGTLVPVDITGSIIEYAGKKLVQGILRDITERRKAEEALKESEHKLRSLTSQLLTIQERERRRISRELHDELGQALTVLKIHLVAIETKLRKNQQALKADCEQILNYIDGVIENVRRLSRDLSPSILEDLGLSSSLGYLIDETCRNHNLSCSFSMDEVDNLFSTETGINIYRIFQESLTNIVKHARATHISVAIRKKDAQVTFVIKDNGKGFDPETARPLDLPKRGLGLTTMQERALMARGSLAIWSQKDQGTQITFHIPMDR